MENSINEVRKLVIKSEIKLENDYKMVVNI